MIAAEVVCDERCACAVCLRIARVARARLRMIWLAAMTCRLVRLAATYRRQERGGMREREAVARALEYRAMRRQIAAGAGLKR